ncbi:MAG TPA: hypothetical protein ENJ32_11730 [Crenotrichaceae bacterium]|nr:hypothetical protein [Crenotrichaceae bacterium]
MGAVYGIINLLVGAWFYRSAHAVKKPAITWAAIGAGVFLGCLIMGYGFNLIMQTITDQDTSVISPSAGSGGSDIADYGTDFVAILYEFIPLIFGLVGAAIVRSVFLLNTGLKDTFGFVKSIKFPSKADVQSSDVAEHVQPPTKTDDIQSSDKTDST